MAITGTGSEDAWQRSAYIAIESNYGATPTRIKLHYEALTETIDIDTGERDLDVKNLLNLGQIPVHGQTGICTITFEGYPQYAGTTIHATLGSIANSRVQPAEAFWDNFARQANLDSTGSALSGAVDDTLMTNYLTRCRIAILWTDEGRFSDTVKSVADQNGGGTPNITVDGSDDFVTDNHNGKMVEMTTIAGSAATAYYGIVDTVESTDDSLVLETNDEPNSDLVADNDTFYIWPTGSGAVSAANKGMRFVIADCFCVSCKTTMTDGIVKQTLVFKGPMFDKAGTANVKMESCTTSEMLPWLGQYTPSTTKWA